MNTITYTGDGTSKTFVFNFPFFLPTDVKVQVNASVLNSGYEMQPAVKQENGNIPYIGGSIIFDEAPQTGDKITIYREIELNRVVDYQPTGKITPENLNQDFSFMIEVLKDFKDKLQFFDSKYQNLMQIPNIDTLNQKLTNFDADIIKLKNAENFTDTGIYKISSWIFPNGTAIDLNFIKTTAGTYAFTPESNGVLSIIITPNVAGTLEILSSTGKTFYNITVAANQRYSILIPVKKRTIINVTVPELKLINFQRLFVTDA